jgi:hypothetical protein
MNGLVNYLITPWCDSLSVEGSSKPVHPAPVDCHFS